MAPLWAIIILTSLAGNMCSLADHLWTHSAFTMTNGTEFSKNIIREPNYICPQICMCNVKEIHLVIKCDDSNLIHFPPDLPPSVSYLSLTGNQIHDLNFNQTLKELNTLNVSQNKIETINKQWLSSSLSLKTLDLSKNFLYSKAIENTFANISILHLNLSNNKLQVITSTVFHNTNTLLTLDLSSNEIESIGDDSFCHLTYLEFLDLSANMLRDIQHEWFKNLGNLKIFNIKQNQLIILRNVVFWPLSNLKLLDLSMNNITSIGLLSFKGLVNLNFLNISNNNVSHFQEGVFRSLESIKTIDISSNPFKSVDKVFTHSASLDALYMRGLTCFKTLTSLSLMGLNKLESLDLSGSKLFSDVNLHAFRYVKNLKKLDLSHANLSNLKMGVFSNLDKVETIKLGGNPWKCDCYMYWILIWLGDHTNTHILSPSETFCYEPVNLKGQVLLDALDHSMVCTNASILHYTRKTKFKVGSTVFLSCQVEGSPTPSLTWITPHNLQFHLDRPEKFNIYKHSSGSSHSSYVSSDEEASHFYLMDNGNLAIKNVGRGDGGFYTCIASNPLSNHSVSVRLTLDYGFLKHIKIVSYLVGMATSFGFLLATLVLILVKMICKRFGIKCPCRNGNHSPRTQQIRRILESMEHYKRQQLDRLRDNYNAQVQRIKDNCMLQMERLRESYSSQAERLRDIRDYGTLQIDRIRENYYSQVQRVRDYSTSQIIKLRENYIYQRNRIRKFSAHHLYKLRENYKLQQQHFNKILENLNIESCRNVCQRTDSVIFEPDITLENVLVPKICLQSFAKEACDSNDNSSQLSAYFTPDEAGSEVSCHEVDEQDCDPSGSLDGNSDDQTEETTLKFEDVTAGSISNIPPQDEIDDPSLQPNVFASCGIKIASSNETIV